MRAGVLVLALSLHAQSPETPARWPSFRGPNASGVADGQELPVAWSERDVLWRTVIPGLRHSSPIVWGDRVFATTAVSAGARARVATGDLGRAGYTASDGKLFFASEDGTVYVVKAGRDYELLASNDLGEVIMATPAVAGWMLIVRGRDHVFAIGDPEM